MARQLNFFDGATSETTPTIGNIVASALVQYPDDATYEATEQGAPTAGNIYYNTTLDAIRYYDADGMVWRTLSPYEVEDNLFHIIGSDDETKKIRFEVDGNTTGVTRVVTTVDEDGVMVLEAATQTLTNKTIEVSANTITTQASGNLASTELNAALDELQTDIDTRELSSNKGIANGYASLDGSGTVPAAQLPSYVDDVLEFADFASLPATGETGKIYVTLDDNKTYRWSGSVYVEVGSNDVTSVNGQTGAVSLSLNDISDVDTTTATPNVNDGLLWNGSEWVPGLSSSVNSMDDLSDADTTTLAPTEGDLLKWDGVNWVPAAAGQLIDSTETLFLPSDVTSPSITILQFTGLTIGDTYRVTLHADMRFTSAAGNQVRVEHNGSLLTRCFADPAGTGAFTWSGSTNKTFIATSTTLEIVSGGGTTASAFINGTGAGDGTYAELEKLNTHDGITSPFNSDEVVYKKNSVLTNNTISDMDFSNLEAGKTYRLTVHTRINNNVSETTLINVTGPDGLLFDGQAIGNTIDFASGTVGVRHTAVDIFTTSSAGNITFTFLASEGDITTGSYAILEELNNYSSTTKWD